MGVRYIFGQDGAFRTEPVIVAKNITENGTYDPATDNADGYAPVTVNVEGGGGTSYTTLFEGSVTTEAEGEESPWADLPEVANLSADTIKVTFNGVEYTCEKQTEDDTTFYGAPLGDDDWSEYPFIIDINPKASSIETETAGTYTLKIEAPQSGGSSDFSTAEVTVVVDNPEIFTGEVGIYLKSTFFTTDDLLYITGEEGIYVENNKAKILMCGNAILNGLSAMDDNYDYTGEIISATGNISKNGSGTLAQWVATGDGTITVHFTADNA